MKYISSGEVSHISHNSIKRISQGFKINNDYCKATTDFISYKDIVLAVNAYFLKKDEQGQAKCQLEFVIPLNRSFPEFELHISISNFILIIIGVCALFFCYFLAKTIGLYIGYFYLIGFGAIILGFFNAIFTFIRKLRMGFTNIEFNKKYSLSGPDIDRIRNFFNEKICYKLVNYELKHNVKTKNNLLILDTFYDDLKEEDLSLKFTEFLKEAIDVAIIFNDTGKSDSVSNSRDLDLVSRKLFSFLIIDVKKKMQFNFSS